MSYNSSKFIVKISIGLVLISTVFVNQVESKPIMSIFDELMSDKFFKRMVSYFIDYDDVRSGSRATTENACTLPVRKGNCRALIRRFRYDPVEKDCVEFNFGGCGGNNNNYETYKDCMTACKGV